MTQHKKRLIEVSLPLEAISKQSAREKFIRHGHISTLHIWWARRLPRVRYRITQQEWDSVAEPAMKYDI